LCKKINIPYLTINTSLEESNPVSFIGQDLHQSGRLAGRLMHLSRPNAKTVAVIHLHENYQNSRHLTEKEKGFREYFSKIDTQVQTIKIGQHASIDKIMHLFNGTVPNGLFITTSKTYLLEPLLTKLAEQTCVVGYDLIEQNTQLLEKGLIDFLIHQNPKQQGYIGLNYLFDYLILKKELPKNKLLPLEVVLRENLDSFKT
jgi:LacI family transcriptional regulator